mmetsp:Transcript_20244/g.29272  ORF Transcript_20244/g.29272 Transcript_20244/m.29272 type:complete len:202 (-) Transcript_20244:1048-1653(-)
MLLEYLEYCIRQYRPNHHHKQRQEAWLSVLLHHSTGVYTLTQTGEVLGTLLEGGQDPHDHPQRQCKTPHEHGLRPLHVSQGAGPCEVPSVLNDAILCSDCEGNDAQEDDVREEALENIHAVPNTSRVDLVEDLAENKGIKYDGEVLHTPLLHPKCLVTLEEEVAEKPQLVSGLHQDIPPHDPVHQVGVPLVRPPAQEGTRG